MTKFILHGGETRRPSASNAKFFTEIAKSHKGPTRILLVYFARKKERWPELFKDDKRKISSTSPRKKLNFVLASKNIRTLIDQLRNADVIYIRGGDTSSLKKVFQKLPKFTKLIENKVVIGSSAGAYLFAKYYFSNDNNRIEKGLGILPIKLLCHYTKAKDQEKLRKLEKYGEKLSTYTIPETRYVIIVWRP